MINKTQIEELRNQAIQLIKAAMDAKTLEGVRVRLLGRKDGEVTKIMRSLKSFSLKEKKEIGPLANALRQEIEEALAKKIGDFQVSASRADAGVDLTMPGKKIAIGHLHPLTIVEKEIREAFKAMNFSVIEGPEAETEYYNFDALNIPENHPARDMWDTFWLKARTLADGTQNNAEIIPRKSAPSQRSSSLLLRTHTSPVQIRYMEQHQPPFQIIVPGRVFRYEATDAYHEMNFYQVEGLMVGRDITLANLKFVIQEFFRRLFRKNLSIRLRPSYFPFVEPGLEVDVECVKCKGQARLPDGQGCKICKESGWLEIMGAGMVHPKVFEAAHYNPREFQGFAFGLGLERIAMLKYNIPDIRLFYSGDMRFIKQF